MYENMPRRVDYLLEGKTDCISRSIATVYLEENGAFEDVVVADIIVKSQRPERGHRQFSPLCPLRRRLPRSRLRALLWKPAT